MPALRKSDSGRRRSRRWPVLYFGFSLLEVVLVVALMGIMAAIAAPRYGRASGRYRADLAARRIVADLRWAQTCAKAASVSRTVSFSTATEQYQLVSVAAPDGKAGDYTVDLTLEPYRANLTGASFGAGGAQVIFTGWGLPNYGGTIVLSIGTEQRTVVVEAGTGRISIQ